MEVEDVVSNENEMMKVEDNRHEIEEIEEKEMFDEILSDDSCFESDDDHVR